MTVDEFEERVAEWHSSDSDLTIYEYLGMTEDEYFDFVLRDVNSELE